MTDTTARLALPFLAAGQAQKEMTHNEALARLDLVVDATVEAVGLMTPPASPLPGQAWVTGAAPTGDWMGQANALAGWTESGKAKGGGARQRRVGAATDRRTWGYSTGHTEYGYDRWTGTGTRDRCVSVASD